MAKKKTKKKTTAKKKSIQKTGVIPATSAAANKKPAQDPAQKKTPPEVVPMPTAGRKVLEFENKLDDALLGAEDQPKRGRGRPRKEVETPPPEIDVKVIAQAIQIPFDIWAISNDCDGLKLSIDEAVLIAKPAKAIVDHYIPQVPEIAWAWFSLTAVSYSVMKSRLMLIAEIKKHSTSEHSAGEKDVQDRRGQGRPRPDAFPSLEEITKPVT